jgi:hypothetical protein
MRKMKIVLVAGLVLLIAYVAVILTEYKGDITFTPEPLKKVDIAYHYVVTQGLAESGMEKVELNGTIWNHGEKEARNLEITALFIDEHYGKITEKPIRVKESLLPDEQMSIHAEYFREKTIPKSSVEAKIRIEWLEDGQRKVRILPPVKPSVSAGLVDFKENVGRYHDRFVLELIPSKKGDYEVIYQFKENNRDASCGDEVFYNVSDENPITIIFPINESSYVEYHIEIFALDGMLLHVSSLSSSVVHEVVE